MYNTIRHWLSGNIFKSIFVLRALPYSLQQFFLKIWLSSLVWLNFRELICCLLVLVPVVGITRSGLLLRGRRHCHPRGAVTYWSVQVTILGLRDLLLLLLLLLLIGTERVWQDSVRSARRGRRCRCEAGQRHGARGQAVACRGHRLGHGGHGPTSVGSLSSH